MYLNTGDLTRWPQSDSMETSVHRQHQRHRDIWLGLGHTDAAQGRLQKLQYKAVRKVLGAIMERGRIHWRTSREYNLCRLNHGT